MSAFLRKYAAATHVYIPMIKRGAVDFAVGADWSPAAGDVKVSIDGGAVANIGTLPTAIASGNGAFWDFTLSGAEVTGKKITVVVVDAATKAVEDQSFVIETYGHANAEHPFDLSVATQSVNVTQFGGNNGTFAGGRPEVNLSHIAGAAVAAGSAQLGVNIVNIAGAAVNAAAAQLGVNVVNFGGAAGTFAGGRPETNTSHIGGSAIVQSGGRAEVNVSHFGGGAGTFAGGRPETNTSHIGGSAIIQAGGRAEVNVSHVAAQSQTARDLGAQLDAAVSTRATPAQVNAEVLDVLNVDTHAEPAAIPAATCTILDRLKWLFSLSRNKILQTDALTSVRNDADSANIATSVTTDDGTTATRAEYTTP